MSGAKLYGARPGDFVRWHQRARGWKGDIDLVIAIDFQRGWVELCEAGSGDLYYLRFKDPSDRYELIPMSQEVT